jgi:hypothetical protein
MVHNAQEFVNSKFQIDLEMIPDGKLVLKTMTLSPNDLANLTTMWPSPQSPMTTRLSRLVHTVSDHWNINNYSDGISLVLLVFVVLCMVMYCWSL